MNVQWGADAERWKRLEGAGSAQILRRARARGFEAHDAPSAGRDPLTGLCEADELLRAVDRDPSPTLAFVLLDIDGFKRFNRRLGYAAGDRLLRKAAFRLVRAVSPGSRVARIDGDQFMVLLADAGDLERVSAFVEALFAAACEPYRYKGTEIQLKASVGVALRPWHATGAADLAGCAARALAQAKEAGGGCCRLFEEGMRPAPSSERPEASEVVRGWLAGEFRLFYQPQVREPDRALVGAEALLRWRHPRLGLLSPGVFLEPIEAGGALASDIGRWVIEQACRDLAAWRAAGIDMPRVAVNLSQEHLRAGPIGRHVAAALNANGLQPGDLELEITERIVLDPDLIHDLQALRDAGVHIALDDFGTGFAGLATLRMLPLSCLKIDRSFVADLREGSADLAVVRAVLSLGQDLGLRVVAEGIEDDDQLARLREAGCRLFQGYLFGMPMPPEEIGRPP